MNNDMNITHSAPGLWLRVATLVLAVLSFHPVEAAEGSKERQMQVSASPEKVRVKGQVLDADARPVIGAAVIVKDNSKLGGAVTDIDGRFTFSVPVGTVLQVSCMGYTTVERTVSSDNELLIVLEEEMEALDDVVVVGYGVQKKESVIGAISQVKGESLVESGTTDIRNALAGKVSGLNIVSISGAPGEQSSETSMVLRGLSSWNGNAPLCMVDGIERSMNALSPEEIASISVLKDASATAVYGAKGANGVILVTTKTGQKDTRPKFNLNVEYSADMPMFRTEHIPAETVLRMANVAYKNAGSFGSLYSEDVIRQYREQTNPLRYPDIDWFKTMTKDLSSSLYSSFSMTGGTKKVRYYIGVGYQHQGSILKEVTPGTRYQYDKFNYRLNFDYDITSTTHLALKVGGATIISQKIGSMGSTSELFSTMYQSPSVTYPAYYPAWALERYPDPDYPDAHSDRIANNQGAKFTNPYAILMDADFISTMTNQLNTDLILKQDLDFITKGLSVKAKVGLTTSYSRVGKQVSQSRPTYNFDWDQVDIPGGQPWIFEGSSNYVWEDKPYAVTQSNGASGIGFTYYLEGSVDYLRSFRKKHNVSALALYSQREYNGGAAFPKRNQSVVGRLTYDFKGKYLLEGNLGITGSEQFAPANRYGIFPSGAVGYYISKERFWKRAMPWWTTMKVRYSHGIVGSDASTANWLYYSAWTRNSSGYIVEDQAANLEAKWETAHKQDLGFELGFFKNRLRMNVDLFDETRDNILMTPVITMFVSNGYKDVNIGALKKHGMEIEVNWQDDLRNGLSYDIGAMVGLNENRITAYNDAPYKPEYQKIVGTQYGSPRTGNTLVDDRYFNTVDELHGYPTYAGEWTNVTTGVYKFLDYLPDGLIQQNDLHILNGTTYAPAIYSINLGLNHKGWSFKTLLTGTIGKYINYRRAHIIPFYSGDMLVHKATVDHWRPDHHDSKGPNVLFNDQMYAWAGGTSTYPGYDLALPGYTWRKSDYLMVKEVLLGYRFSGPAVKRALGVSSLAINLTGNNLWSFFDKSLYDTDPQRLTTASNYYPTMRVVKLSVKLGF